MNDYNGSPTPELSGTSAGMPDYDPLGTRLLHVYYDSKLGTKVRVTDADKTTTLYNIKSRLTKPHLVIESSLISNAPTTATVSFHSFSTRIDITIQGQEFTMKPSGKWRSNFQYTSQATAGAQRTWECQKRGNGLDSVCTDEHGTALARLKFANWSLKKVGSLELVESVGTAGPAMDEIVVTALAIVQAKLTQHSAASAAAASVAV